MAGSKGRNIPTHIYRSLLARSGNKCAFPGCPRPIVNTKHVYEAQLCHIESVSDEKQRHNPNLNEAELNGYNNLMFLCLKHHIETNDEVAYTVQAMRDMKYEHESKYVENPYHIDVSHVYPLKKEAEAYWDKVAVLKISNPSLMTLNTRAEYSELSANTLETLELIETIIGSFDNEVKQKYWDALNVELPNRLNKIKILTEHMLIKYLETFIESNPQDMNAKGKLDSLRNQFLTISPVQPKK